MDHDERSMRAGLTSKVHNAGGASQRIVPTLITRNTIWSLRYVEIVMYLRSRPISIMVLACLTTLSSFPAMALTPLRSPEQLAKDKLLFARASSVITPKVMQCFRVPRKSALRPFKVRFFLEAAGRRPAQFAILEEGANPRAARSGTERAAIRAINRCAPYDVPEELRNWGGFWATVEFK
jgi:hypothetical protein